MIHWDVIGIIWLSVLGVAMLLAFTSLYFYKRILKLYKDKQFDLVIEKSDRYKRILPGIIGQYTLLLKGYSFLNNGDYDSFIETIDRIKVKKMQYIKYYWKTLVCMQKEDFVRAMEFYELFQKSSLYTIKEYSFDQLYSQLTGVFEYREKDYTSAK
ncbi:MAG: hypothetical protein KKH01_03680, partial [Firmicutes bacterium]|nr:hypothetical protein [Bacillota bacterium]